MNKNRKFMNTFVVGFDDLNDPKRKELVSLMLDDGKSDDVPEWTLFTSTDNVIDNKDVFLGDQFRRLTDGCVLGIVDVGYSLINHSSFAVCDIDNNPSTAIDSIVYLDDLLDITIYGKMHQNKAINNEQ